MNFLISWLALTLAVWLTAAVLPGVHVKSFGSAIAVAAVFGIINWAFGRVLYLAIGLGTLGLGFWLASVTRVIVNAILLKITDALTDKLKIDGFGWALAAGALITFLVTLAERALHAIL